MKSYLRASGIANHQPEVIDIILKITGAKTAVPVTPGVEIISGADAGSFTQAAADTLLGTGDIPAVTTSFGSTRMGTDTFGIIIGLDGNVRELLAVESIVQLATGASVVSSCAGSTTALTDALANKAAFAITALGNVYGSITVTSLDAATSGFIHLRLICRLK